MKHIPLKPPGVYGRGCMRTTDASKHLSIKAWSHELYKNTCMHVAAMRVCMPAYVVLRVS